MKTFEEILLSGKRKDKRETTYQKQIDALYSYLSPLQQSFIDDPAHFKLARCGRRAGKSVMDAVYLIIVALSESDIPVLYLGQTRDSVKRVIWPVLLLMLETFNIPHDPRVSELRIILPNRSFIQGFGADTRGAKDRLRGQNFKLIIADEMDFISEADSLLDMALPMLADHGGTFCMTSSPGVVLGGFFYEADQGEHKEEWKQWHWTMYDNPHFQQVASDPKYKNKADEEMHKVVRLKYKGDWTNPAFRREWLGEWVADNTSLVYPYSRDINITPDNQDLTSPQYGIGLDVSSNLVNTIVVMQYSHYSRKVEVVESHKFVGETLEVFGGELKKLYDRYDPTFVVAHSGKIKDAVIQELRRRLEIPITVGVKGDLGLYQRLFADDLMGGRVGVWSENGLLLRQEWDKIVKNKDGSELEGQDSYLSNACLQIWRKVYQTHLATYQEPQTEEEKMLEHILGQVRKEKEERGEFDEFTENPFIKN